jgi:hypothetical protein
MTWRRRYGCCYPAELLWRRDGQLHARRLLALLLRWGTRKPLLGIWPYKLLSTKATKWATTMAGIAARPGGAFRLGSAPGIGWNGCALPSQGDDSNGPAYFCTPLPQPGSYAT